jgi:hypothetical protein
LKGMHARGEAKRAANRGRSERGPPRGKRSDASLSPVKSRHRRVMRHLLQHASYLDAVREVQLVPRGLAEDGVKRLLEVRGRFRVREERADDAEDPSLGR